MQKAETFRALSRGTIKRQLKIAQFAIALAFVCEIVTHYLVKSVPEFSTRNEALTEAAVLSLLMFPVLYLFVLVPNARQAKQRKAVEDALVESESKLSAIFRTMAEGVALNEIVYDGNGEMIDYRILEVNEAFHTVADLRTRDVVGRLATDLYGMSPEVIREFWKTHRHQHNVQHTEMLSPLHHRWFYVSTSPFQNDRFVTSFLDITERKRGEDTLRESEHLLRETQALAGMGTYVLDFATGTWRSSDILDDIFGIGREFDRTVEGWLSLVHPDWRERMHRHLTDEVLAADRRFDMAYRVIRRGDGESRWVHGLGQVERDAQGQPLRMIGSIRDITASKQHEEQFLQAQRLESIGTLASGIAHDLNNVLAPIMMSVELLKSTTTDSHSHSLLDIAGASARRGADIVSQVLSFSRGSAGRRVSVQVRHLIREIEKITLETFPKNIRVRTTASRELWTVLADPTQLHQVLLNLCINARDAMPDGGELTITADNVMLSTQYASMNIDVTAGPHVLIQVRDTGMGIQENVIGKIFDPFFTTKASGEGTGLGLSTSLTIVKHHGGFLRVSSEVGVGTRFRIHLPAQNPGQFAEADSVAGEWPRGVGELVLVVDDEASVRDVTRHMLEASGYRAVLASDGAAGVAIYRERGSEVSAVIMDMMMPVMSGATAIRELMKINPAVRVIAVSGVEASGHALPAGGTIRFLAKPYSPEMLLGALQQCLADNP